jgi:predicted transcriptional regulator
MSIDQMLKHAILADEMYLGEKVYKRHFLGYLLGKRYIKSDVKGRSAHEKDATTSPEFIVTETGGNVEVEKVKWIIRLNNMPITISPNLRIGSLVK